MINKIFEEQNSWAESQTPDILFKNFAHQLNLNGEEFSKCINSEEKLQIIQEGINSATKEKLHSTPTIFINKNKIEGLHSKEHYQEILNIEFNKISEKSE